MAKQKERWGAYVELERGGQTRELDGSFSTIYNYKVRIGKYEKQKMKKGEAFVSNPRISKRIAKVQKILGFEGKHHIGNMSFWIRGGKKEIIVSNYYPFYHFMSVWNPTGTNKKLDAKIFRMLTGMGLANRIELRALKDLQKKFPGYLYVTSSKNPDASRVKQLENRGSEVGKAVPIQEEIQRIANRIGGFAKKNAWRRKLRRRIRGTIRLIADIGKRRKRPGK